MSCMHLGFHCFQFSLALFVIFFYFLEEIKQHPGQLLKTIKMKFILKCQVYPTWHDLMRVHSVLFLLPWEESLGRPRTTLAVRFTHRQGPTCNMCVASVLVVYWGEERCLTNFCEVNPPQKLAKAPWFLKCVFCWNLFCLTMHICYQGFVFFSLKGERNWEENKIINAYSLKK